MSLPVTALPQSILDTLYAVTGARQIQIGDTLQTLWSGYGAIIRVHFDGAGIPSAILKLITHPTQADHPRGWNTDDSHQRKVRSYQVESQWYRHYAEQCSERCRVPLSMATGQDEQMQWILMEDLTHQFPVRAQSLTLSEAEVCLRWLAAFHAQFLGQTPNDLWPVGTYWHLATRQDELNAMPEGRLKAAAAQLDKLLNDCPHQTLVHGDAKVANFCFNKNKTAVAAVDFQYVGGGVGIKDVIYFLGSCLHENTIQQHESSLLALYFNTLRDQITHLHCAQRALQVEEAWRALYAIAWTDFYRFLDGWMPGHTKINNYTKSLARRAFDQLDQ